MKERKIPMRKCVGCMESKEKQELIRIAVFEGRLTVDPSGRAKGRGIYLCKNNPQCFEAAVKRKAFERTVQGRVADEEKQALLAALEELREETR